ncbi:penicillin-binding protein activator [Desulfobacula sp.]|uniref:penicillin-binding protein activator n=1 Tax=Desulfobacula sp. TaxID=2593537 RepID=UPI002621E962|nr:penicillin-binding protein activator [Desulfobacula sp.]
MKPKYSSLLILFLFVMMMVWLPACAQRHVKPSAEKEKRIKQVPVPGEEKREADQSKISIVAILSDEAEKFIRQKNYKDALFAYNQALDQASEAERSPLISRIESLLAKTPTAIIAEVMDNENIHIPRPLLLYWLGLNFSMENNAVRSKNILESFLSEYPDHPYAADAADLVAVIKKIVFKRDTIGCLLPLTGKYAIFGQRALSGIQLAIQELSKKYSREFKLIIKDTQANPDMAIEGVRQLHQKNVAGIIGPLLTVNPAGQEAQKLGMPMIALTQKNDFPFQGDYLFSNFISPQMQVQTLGAYLFLKLGIKKVAILYPNEKYGKKYMELFWDIVDEYNGEVVGVESYDGKKTDFTVPIQKLTGQFFPVPEFLKPAVIESENNPGVDADVEMDSELTETEPRKEKVQIDFQALFIPDSPSKVGLILPQLAFNDATGMYLVGTNLWHDNRLLKNAKGYHHHAIITDGFFDNSQKSATTQFTQKFESLFNTKPQFLEAISYDTASLLFLAAMDETIDSRAALKDALKGKRIFEGVTGHTIFDQFGAAHRELFLITIKKGEFVEISR